MERSIIIIGTLDTKGDQVEYLNNLIKERGNSTMVMDVGVKGEPPFKPEISHDDVAKAVGMTLEEMRTLSYALDPKPAMDKMAEGASNIIKDMCSKGEINGVLALGGSVGTALALDVMKVVPLGIPKIIVSTIAHSPAVVPDMMGGDDVMMLPWTAGLWGINDISRGVLQTAAGAIAGAAQEYDKRKLSGKKIVGATSLGGTGCRYMNFLKPALEERDYEVAVFHVTGMSGRAFERAISDGLIDFSLDLAAGVECLNHVSGSGFGPGENRLEAAGKKGIPQIVSTGAIEIIHWGQDRPIPDKFKDRFSIWHNKILLQIGSGPEECAAAGEMMAKQVNKAQGPTAVVLPMKSLAMLLSSPPGEPGAPPPPPPDGAHGGPPPEDMMKMTPSDVMMAFLRDSFMETVNSDIKVVELDMSFNEPAFADEIMKLFDEMV